mgnify:CR=1 FL=1
MEGMLFDPARHEPLRPLPWKESEAEAAIERIVADTEARFTGNRYWPLHPLDRQAGDEAKSFVTSLYDGACGVFWALHYLAAVGARSSVEKLRKRMGRAPRAQPCAARGFAEAQAGLVPAGRHSDSDDVLWRNADCCMRERARRLDCRQHRASCARVDAGFAGNLAAALFLHEHTGKERWADLFRMTAARLWSQLEWSPQHQCSYWTQELFGRQSAYLGAVHGFVATALPLIRGRNLLDADAWIALGALHRRYGTAHRRSSRGTRQLARPTRLRERPQRGSSSSAMEHPASSFALLALPSATLDDLLLAAGETIWSAGPLTKGSNLCPRHRRQRIRPLEALSANGGYALAGARAVVRDARNCASTGRCVELRAIEVLVVDGRSRLRRLSVGLLARGRTVSDAGRLFAARASIAPAAVDQTRRTE